jgi:hypothetical protein
MAERGNRKRPPSKGAKATEEGVLGSLPSTRPARMSRRRETPAGTAAETPKPAKATPAKQARPARPSSPKPTASRKPATPRAARPSSPKPEAASGPRAVRAGSPSLEPPKRRRAQPESSPPKGAELVTTAVQAAGELAQIGFTIGGQMVKRAVKKLPKP